MDIQIVEKDKQLAELKAKSNTELVQKLGQKESEIAQIKAKIDKAEVEKKLAIQEAVQKIEKQRDDLVNDVKTKELEKRFKAIKQACLLSIPTWSKEEKQIVKCNMCYDRVEAGLLPACVKACPSGALNFGDEAEMKKLATDHLAAAKKKFGGKGELLDFEDVRALYPITDEQSKYRPRA